MGLVRLALIAAAVVVALVLIKRLLGGRPAQTPPTQPTPPRLVQCAHCGVHVSEGEAIRSGDRYYCCPDHQQRG